MYFKNGTVSADALFVCRQQKWAIRGLFACVLFCVFLCMCVCGGGCIV